MPCVSAILPNFTGKFIGEGGCLELLEALGTGAYGAVYHAVAAATPRHKAQHFAVKCLLKSDFRSRHKRHRTDELYHHQTVSGHPNIATFHGMLEDDHFVYIVMDYCPGGDLFSVITDDATAYSKDDEVRTAFLQIVDAVEHCHSKGIYHRDLKPENVICSQDHKTLYLTDFGLATRDPISSDLGCGSSHYMSPECIGRDVRRKSYGAAQNDVWSLGVILVNMITRRQPWNTATMNDELFCSYLHTNDFLTKMLPLSDEVADLLKRVFVMNPYRRITLTDMRKEVANIKRFWASSPPVDVSRPVEVEEEPVTATFSTIIRVNTAQWAAVYLASQDATFAVDEEGNFIGAPAPASDPEEEYVWPSPNANSPGFPPAPVLPDFQGGLHHRPYEVIIISPGQTVSDLVSASSLASVVGLAPIASGSNSSDSTEDGSEEAITPETHAVDPDPETEIPDIPEEEGLNELAYKGAIVQPVADPVGETATAPPKSPTPSLMLKKAVRKLRALQL